MNIDNKLTFGKEYDSIIEEPIYGNYYTIKNNLVGIIDKEGKVIIENNYLQIMPSYKGYYDLRSKKGLGLFSLKHGLIIPATYDKIEKINDKFFVGVNGSIHNDIYNYKSNKVIKSDVKIVDDCGGNTITSGGFDSKTHGYYEEDTEVKIVEFKYKSIVNKEYEHYLAQTLKGKYVILDAKFKEVTPKHDAFLQYSGQSSIGFEQDGLWGLIDLNNNVIIKPKYELIYPEIEGYIVAQLNEKYGVINNKEEIIIPFEYELLGTYTNGVFLCVTEEISGYVDLNNIVYSLQRHNNSDYVYYQDQNKELGPLKTPNELNYVFEDSIIFEIDEKVGWIDGSGKIILDALYDEVSNVLYGGLGFVKKDDKWAFYDRDKGFITEFIYDEAGFLIKGYCLGIH